MTSQSPSFEMIDLERLEFDADNPRFPTTVNGSDTAAVLRFMLNDAGLIDLMRSIAKQGFVPGEPLLVCRSSKRKIAFTVVEGNRRLASCKLLADPGLAPTKTRAVETAAVGVDAESIRNIPCLVFPDRPSILKHLGYRHVTGIKDWEPLAKARFLLNQFKQESGETSDRLRSVARSIGSRSDYVGRLLTALTLYQHIESENYFAIKGLEENSIEFSLLSSVLAYKEIVEFLGLRSAQDLSAAQLKLDSLKLMTQTIYERRGGTTALGESRNIRLLASVLTHDAGVTALRAGLTVREAAQVLSGTTDDFRGYIETARSSIRLAGEALSRAYLNDLDVNRTWDLHSDAEALLNQVTNHVNPS